MRFGVGLWTGQSTALAPRHHAAAYRDLLSDARLADELGFESLWMSEHHFYYDGYCPSLLTAAGAVLAATERLRFGTGVLLLPYQDPDRLLSALAVLANDNGDRIDLGVSIGYRDVEFDGKGISRKQRLRRHLAAVDAVRRAHPQARLPIWMGAQAEKSVRRAGALGVGLFLPGSASLEHVADLVGHHRAGWEEAGRPGGTPPEVAALRNVWICDSDAEREAAESWVRSSYVLYQGLGYAVGATENAGAVDFAASFEQASRSVLTTSLLGTTEAVLAGLAAVGRAGVDHVVLRMNLEGASRPAVTEQMRRLSERVLPHGNEMGAA